MQRLQVTRLKYSKNKVCSCLTATRQLCTARLLQKMCESPVFSPVYWHCGCLPGNFHSPQVDVVTQGKVLYAHESRQKAINGRMLMT